MHLYQFTDSLQHCIFNYFLPQYMYTHLELYYRKGTSDNQSKPTVVSTHTYHKFWCLHYPNLKVSSIWVHVYPECYKCQSQEVQSNSIQIIPTSPRFNTTILCQISDENDESNLNYTKDHYKISTKAKTFREGFGYTMGEDEVRKDEPAMGPKLYGDYWRQLMFL